MADSGWAEYYVNLYLTTKDQAEFSQEALKSYGGVIDETDRFWDMIDAAWRIFTTPKAPPASSEIQPPSRATMEKEWD